MSGASTVLQERNPGLNPAKHHSWPLVRPTEARGITLHPPICDPSPEGVAAQRPGWLHVRADRWTHQNCAVDLTPCDDASPTHRNERTILILRLRSRTKITTEFQKSSLVLSGTSNEHHCTRTYTPLRSLQPPVVKNGHALMHYNKLLHITFFIMRFISVS